jgi:dTDP-4-dehydrorhamnose reductase
VKVLITGAAGQLGHELPAVFDDLDVVGVDHHDFDLGRRDDVLAGIDAIAPSIIVHAGAITDVDGCERNADDAFRVNALGARHVAEAARRLGAHVVFISTDYVFDGCAPRPYVEWDPPCPVSVYGRSKHAGELEIDPGWTIVRTSGVFGRHGRNIVKAVLALAEQPGRLRFVDDQRTCPTAADDLASVVRLLATSRMPGTYHVTNQGPTTWFEFARDVLRFAGHDADRVEPISSVELARPAPRPANAVLDNAALRLSGLPLLPDHREPVERLVKELIAP